MTTRRTGRPATAQWADLADHILVIARELAFRGYTSEGAIQLSQSEGMVMRHLQGNPSALPSQIADATGLQRTNLSQVLNGLQRKGLIERRQVSTDKRHVQVVLTDRGRDNYRTVRREWAAAVADAAGGHAENLPGALELLAAIDAGMREARPGSS